MELGSVIMWGSAFLLSLVVIWFIFYTRKAPEHYTPECFGSYPFKYPVEEAEWDCPNCLHRSKCMYETVIISQIGPQ